MSEHTTLPWMVDGLLIVIDPPCPRKNRLDTIASISNTWASETVRANAEFIVRACNSHNALLEACRRALLVNEESFQQPHGRGCGCDRCDLATVLRAAITKAT